MYYINPTPSKNGAYGAPQNKAAHGLVAIDNKLLSTFLEYNGFVTLTFANNAVVELSPNVTAWEAWKAWKPAPQPTPPTTEERLAATEAAILALMGGAANV